ncbi:GILT-like protein 1 isoform X2 [Ceratitis capitata]|uniref:GILT-like protein 1 isoform X2 n=1 Tax=Ceratitis capitata TaxID=7213 RepID=UPI000A10B4F5|nr:GILT-like protein 1 isoform X2 [Ceratitis capitata]
MYTPVTIYYESLCPDSANFISEQVYPAVNGELQDYIDLIWVPFGKANFTPQGDDVIFTCQHGPDECYGNKVHACAIEHIQTDSNQTESTRESSTLEFINCMMKAGRNFDDNVYPGVRCARESNVRNWENIQQCANSTEGSHLLKKQGEITQNFQNPISFVPTVDFKQHYDAEENYAALTNFVEVSCKYIPKPQPEVCAAYNSAVATTLKRFLTLITYLLLRLV